MNVIDLNRERRLRRGGEKPRYSRRPFGGRGTEGNALPVSIGELTQQIIDRLNKGR